MPPLLQSDERGLACPAGGFWIDPWGATPIAIISHAHSDHARAGSAVYYCAAPGAELLKRRLPPGAEIRPLEYGAPIEFGPTRVSLHPAGHILGAAQVRVEHASGVWVFSGDYKRAPDPTAAPFEVVPCDTFITEATFSLPIYRWAPTAHVVGEILAWWRENAAAGRASVLSCYALGKTQRILAELKLLEDAGAQMPGRVLLHGATASLVDAYRLLGVRMLDTAALVEEATRRKRADTAGVLAIAPPSAGGTPWMRRFGAGDKYETAFASGWMQVRGIRRRRGYDRGFVLSDHADWPELIRTIEETGAKRILCTHGNSDPLVRFLRERGKDAAGLATAFQTEDEE